jgi:hypothetical protein
VLALDQSSGSRFPPRLKTKVGSIWQEDIIIVHACLPSSRSPRYVKPILIKPKGEMHCSTIIIGDASTPFSVIQTENQQRNIGIKLYFTPDQMDPIDIYRTSHQQLQNVHSSHQHLDYSAG